MAAGDAGEQFIAQLAQLTGGNQGNEIRAGGQVLAMLNGFNTNTLTSTNFMGV